jgi:hypothetical protein
MSPSIAAAALGAGAGAMAPPPVGRTRYASGRSAVSATSYSGGPALQADPADPIYQVMPTDTPEILAKKVRR